MSPPFRLYRRRRGAADYIPLEDASHDASPQQPTTSTTTSLPQSRRPPLQSVYYRADDPLYNQSTTEQTTPSTISLLQSRRPPL
jgi:hypothetical protein